jgi:hypothetical protein
MIVKLCNNITKCHKHNVKRVKADTKWFHAQSQENRTVVLSQCTGYCEQARVQVLRQCGEG